jgi:hypothetical protein
VPPFFKRRKLKENFLLCKQSNAGLEMKPLRLVSKYVTMCCVVRAAVRPRGRSRLIWRNGRIVVLAYLRVYARSVWESLISALNLRVSVVSQRNLSLCLSVYKHRSPKATLTTYSPWKVFPKRVVWYRSSQGIVLQAERSLVRDPMTWILKFI